MNSIHYFGIRHHGPGSSRRLVSALEHLKPAMVLIEGPADLSALAPLLAHPDMRLPVALMAFATDNQGASIYYPFAEFSPEYQAICFAVSQQIPVRFIDVPVAQQLAGLLNKSTQAPESTNDAETQHELTEPATAAAASAASSQDPMAMLAQLAGYEDGESWWNQVLEQGSMDDPSLFASISTTMAALRHDNETAETLRREAYMRLQIAEAQKEVEGPIAVVCGAWHVPALQTTHSKKADKALIGELPAKLSAKQFASTWIPWSSPRLAFGSGYGAGVTAPQWYLHLWQQGNDEHAMIHWLTRVANALRDEGTAVSTASVIEATRLCQSLAMVRNRPSAGFEEARDASIACLCFGNPLLWQQIESKLLLGDAVGAVPEDVPLAPLLADLQQWQKQTRLKPSALPVELSLDLRSDAGLAKSVLLRRLQLLNVAWGTPASTGNSRGTFRERWTLLWQPEFAVRLVEQQIYGSTIAQAAAALTAQRLQSEKRLANLADLVLTSLEAQLPDTAALGIQKLAERAAHSSECLELLLALPPLVDINRYGTSREMTLAHLADLVEQMVVQAALALPFAVRNLNEEESERFQQAIDAGHRQLELAQCSSHVLDTWWKALVDITHDDGCDAGARGIASRLLYQNQRLTADETQGLLQKLLSPALPVLRTKSFFAGFFANASEQLLYDHALRQLTNDWLMSLEPQAFIECLPVVRRVFSTLDAMERRRLIDAALQGTPTATVIDATPHQLELLPHSLSVLTKLLQGDPLWMN